jgi:hypothetical protein
VGRRSQGADRPPTGIFAQGPFCRKCQGLNTCSLQSRKVKMKPARLPARVSAVLLAALAAAVWTAPVGVQGAAAFGRAHYRRGDDCYAHR